jgi:hypothetical protein
MLKKTIFLFVFIFLSTINAKDLIKLHVNKNLAFITFIESISGASYVSEVPKRIYLSKYKNDIEKFVKLHQKISKKRIYKHPKTKNFLEAIYIESLNSKSFKTFESNIRSFKVGIKDKYLKKYFWYLNKLYPRFEKVLWSKTKKGLVYRKNKLEKLMKDKKFNIMIEKILKFYDVKSDEIGIMDIAFYPISYGNNINAYSIGNIETIGIFIGKSQNLNWMLSATILHELAHSIYRKSKFIQRNFLNIKDKTRNTTINEIFATAIGAGWGYNQLTNKYATKQWYNNKIYNKFAKKIYPKLKKYINSGKKIDKKFAVYIKGLL